jgi:hypothetical protein
LPEQSQLVEPVGKLPELAHRDAERRGDTPNGAPRGVGVTTLNQGEGAGSYIGLMGKVFLSEAAFLAKLVDRFA